MAPIVVGDVIPDGTLAFLDNDNKPYLLLYCCLKHVPGFIERAEELKGKGVDESSVSV
nr:peroxiredoxin-2B-like [Arachis hypogaea]